MICLYAETHSSTFSLIFFTCICTPFLQITKAALRIFTYLLDPHHQPQNSFAEETLDWELDLLDSRFQDLKSSDKNGGEEIDREEICAICLTEFEKEDMVNKLARCVHVFHKGCMEKWVERCQFTCPLCRCSVLRIRSSPCKTWNSPFRINLTHAHDS